MSSIGQEWIRTRNLSLDSTSERKLAMIYILSRVGRESLPSEVLGWLALQSPGWFGALPATYEN
jgi:hypothetical protein